MFIAATRRATTAEYKEANKFSWTELFRSGASCSYLRPDLGRRQWQAYLWSLSRPPFSTPSVTCAFYKVLSQFDCRGSAIKALFASPFGLLIHCVSGVIIQNRLHFKAKRACKYLNSLAFLVSPPRTKSRPSRPFSRPINLLIRWNACFARIDKCGKARFLWRSGKRVSNNFSLNLFACLLSAQLKLVTYLSITIWYTILRLIKH